jgi:hypothetical protein
MTTLPPPEFVYRISTADEWAELERTGGTHGGDLDRSTGCIHLSDLSQVPRTENYLFDLFRFIGCLKSTGLSVVYSATDSSWELFFFFLIPDRSLAVFLDALYGTGIDH